MSVTSTPFWLFSGLAPLAPSSPSNAVTLLVSPPVDEPGFAPGSTRFNTLYFPSCRVIHEIKWYVKRAYVKYNHIPQAKEWITRFKISSGKPSASCSAVNAIGEPDTPPGHALSLLNISMTTACRVVTCSSKDFFPNKPFTLQLPKLKDHCRRRWLVLAL